MTRTRLIWLIVGAPLAALAFWVASNVEWVNTPVPMPPQGEALSNPFYAVQRFAERLGARTSWERTFTSPPSDAVLVISAFHWNLSAGRRQAIERWVEAGGRLVVDDTLLAGDEFERWSGIVSEYREFDEDAPDEPVCRRVWEGGDGVSSNETRYWLCDTAFLSFLTTTRTVEWSLRDDAGIQAMRVQVGKGHVTVINASPFGRRRLFDGDHDWLFVRATQFRKGDEVRFLSEDDPPSLLALLWQYGAPVVVLGITFVALLLWRGGMRFGPPAATPSSARRSLAEQIRGTGQFALRHGSGDALHAASVRALDEAAQRRIPGYTHLSPDARATALAGLTGFDRDALAAAVHHPRSRHSNTLRGTIALLESARRRTLDAQRSSSGTD